MKDNFSSQSELYAKYRPHYPNDFFKFLDSTLTSKNIAWDCGTGNGQVAYQLSKMFTKVYATDISDAQLKHAFQLENIEYSLQPAERTNFAENSFDCITIAQAIHWFDFELFYKEVKRTAKKNAVIAAIGYGRIETSKDMDHIIDHFYQHTIGSFWDKERRYIDEKYKMIPFPFEEIKTPDFSFEMNWTEEQLIGYINTWSAVKHYTKQNGINPVYKLQSMIKPFWENQKEIKVSFPLLLRMGYVT
ncbi:class I SAM-dependent methyltransferase [Leptospira jelokensis]|uniref:Class I SAM-dependent methyltransferase n=1 Tax=Leptospira jelokensis TaxID=2484931 RepID=A0A4Z0ZZB2_9LEPT|nr:class I SAM-dependent methyltransferase [Leptospira jelokensis]TGL65430.1 class I SAM-dependent methyltransferase [Leptospira jelokensis]